MNVDVANDATTTVNIVQLCRMHGTIQAIPGQIEFINECATCYKATLPDPEDDDE